MAIVTKNTLPVRDYQVWTNIAGEVNMADGDVLGVYESLGFRVADTVTMESETGASRVQFNVVSQIHREQGNTWSGVNNADGTRYIDQGVQNQWATAIRPSPVLVGEVTDLTKPDIVVAVGASQTWSISELPIKDIRIVVASGLRITVT